jgi:hypothetical protein
MTFHHWSLTEWFPLCSMKEHYSHIGIHAVPWIPFVPIGGFLTFVDSLHYWLLFIGSLSCTIYIWCTRDILHGGPFNISSESFQIFGLLLLLMLDDGGCLNSLLPMDLFLSTSTHLSLGQGSRVIISTLGLAVISGRFPHY